MEIEQVISAKKEEEEKSVSKTMEIHQSVQEGDQAQFEDLTQLVEGVGEEEGKQSEFVSFTQVNPTPQNLKYEQFNDDEDEEDVF